MLNRYHELEEKQQKNILKLTTDIAKQNKLINQRRPIDIKRTCEELLKEYVYIDYDNQELIYNNQYLDEESLQEIVLDELTLKEMEK